MNKRMSMFLFVTIILSATNTYAAIGKEKYCPLLNQIKFNDQRLFAYNSDNKPFSSGFPCVYCDSITSMKPLSFQPELTKYNDADKTLACVYEVEVFYNDSRGIKTELKSLVNEGDY